MPRFESGYDAGFGMATICTMATLRLQVCTMTNAAPADRMYREYTAAMRLRPLLLHALLCLALVANGIGAAMASVHSGCDHQLVSHTSVVVEAPAASPPCHMGVQTPHTTDLPTPTHEMGHISMPPGGGSADDAVSDHPGAISQDAGSGHGCGSSCHCACIAHAQAVLVPAGWVAPAFAAIAYAPAHPLNHTAPTLPHLVRPPIA